MLPKNWETSVQYSTHVNLGWLYKTPDATYLKDWLLFPIGALMIPSWLLGLIIIRHPLAEEAVFKKIVFYRIGGAVAISALFRNMPVWLAAGLDKKIVERYFIKLSQETSPIHAYFR
jgi:hypothetical protein